MHIEPIYQELGEQIKSHREALKLSQNQFAEKVGLSRASIANIEAGRQRIHIHQLIEFAQNLNVGPLELIPPKSDSYFVQALPEDASPVESTWFKKIVNEAIGA